MANPLIYSFVAVTSYRYLLRISDLNLHMPCSFSKNRFLYLKRT